MGPQESMRSISNVSMCEEEAVQCRQQGPQSAAIPAHLAGEGISSLLTQLGGREPDVAVPLSDMTMLKQGQRCDTIVRCLFAHRQQVGALD